MKGSANFMWVFLLLVAAFGTFAGLRLSIVHLRVAEVCPMLGPVPACVVVSVGYFLVLLAALFYHKKWSIKLFYIGWIPVFILAFSGVILELIRGQTCPPGPNGIPQCFISLAMILVAWALFKVIRKSRFNVN